ncbi:MAG: hypothetical protein IPP99_10685 [Chitinophagaceae bacterium]|nr:hypothetical protein [Chitinophagaceae bacterium]
MEYKLKGAEDEWTLAGDKHEALYNNLNPGTYQFMVRVRGKNSSWQTSEAVVKFTIKPLFTKPPVFLRLLHCWWRVFCTLFIATGYTKKKK